MNWAYVELDLIKRNSSSECSLISSFREFGSFK